MKAIEKDILRIIKCEKYDLKIVKKSIIYVIKRKFLFVSFTCIEYFKNLYLLVYCFEERSHEKFSSGHTNPFPLKDISKSNNRNKVGCQYFSTILSTIFFVFS